MKRSGKLSPKNSSANLPIIQLVIMAIAITIMAAILVQNLQPLVQIFFLGQKTLPIPLSVAMLVAFGIGGGIALTINAIASWRQNVAIGRAVAARFDDSSTEAKFPSPERDQGAAKPNPQSFYQDSQTSSQNTAKNNSQSIPQNNTQDDLQDELDDWEEDLEDEIYEDEEFLEDELEDEIYEDEDPDTVPYGDLQKLKSANPKRQKRDRPPLDARYIR